MDKQATEQAVRTKYGLLRGVLGERARRLWAGAEALTLGRGGVSLVVRATGLSRTTVTAGVHELSRPQPEQLDPRRERRVGGGGTTSRRATRP
jgi:hypothetical protein